MTIKCSINFDSTVVYPKQYFTGTIGLQTLRTTLMEFIIVDVVGIATCEWSYLKPFFKCFRFYKRGTKFKGYQEFFRSRHTLAGGDTTVSLTSEPQIYRFKTFLPEYLPATWNGKHGSIQYIAKVIIKELNELVQVFPSQITIKPYRDLNLEKHLLRDVMRKVHRTFRFGIVNLGNVEVSVWLPLSGVAAGQSIPIMCTIINNSKVFFGGIVFVLTQIEIYRSTEPTTTAKTVRKDICRVARMVDVLRGTYIYYAVVETDEDTPPTNQYYRCNCCQLIYEIWVSLQGDIPRYHAYGYPNIDTPGISIIVGTRALHKWNVDVATRNVIAYINETRPLMEINDLPADDEVEEILKNVDEKVDKDTDWNIGRQLTDNTLCRTEEVCRSKKNSDKF